MKAGDYALRIEQIGDNTQFIFLPELEPVWGVIDILSDEENHTLCSEIYGWEQIRCWKRKYHFLFEAFHALGSYGAMNLLDYILDLPPEGLDLNSYRDHLLSLPSEDVIWRTMNLDFGAGTDYDTLRRAMTDDDALDQVYGWVSDDCGSFLAFSAYVRQNRRFLLDFFSMAQELNNEALSKAILGQEHKISLMLEEAREGIAKHGAFGWSEKRMGKTFRNRGPYSEFVFLPSLLMPRKACRFFNVEGEYMRQVLFLSLREVGHTPADTVKALKAMADPTRYQILMLLAQEGPMRGLDIARKVSIATSTVSHHMDQMKECGLITEEPVKNSKYYGLNTQSAKALLEEIRKDFKIE